MVESRRNVVGQIFGEPPMFTPSYHPYIPYPSPLVRALVKQAFRTCLPCRLKTIAEQSAPKWRHLAVFLPKLYTYITRSQLSVAAAATKDISPLTSCSFTTDGQTIQILKRRHIRCPQVEWSNYLELCLDAWVRLMPFPGAAGQAQYEIYQRRGKYIK
jgi:hypothetical protein